MRPIKFRGKCKDKGQLDYENKWVYGCYFTFESCMAGIKELHHYIGDRRDHEEVVPETVGQFTGLKDKNGKEIYDGDLLNTSNVALASDDKLLGVKYSGTAFCVYNPFCCNTCADGYGCIGPLDEWPDGYEVIGNVHDNPELLLDNKT